jgi:outer membrane lipoprotein carrier protein
MLKLPLAVAAAAVPIALTATPVAQTKPVTRVPDARQIADRVQKFYDAARTYQADFRQRYWLKAYNRYKVDSGRVAFQKPGKASWRYSSNANRIVSDGKTVKVYEARNKQLFVQAVDKSQYPAALSFLVGGRLRQELSLRKLADDPSFPRGYRLEGAPRSPSPAYEKLVLFVDAGTYHVRRVLLLDAQGNRNRFDFDRPVVNRGIPPAEFVFKAPPGTQLIRQ